MYAVLSMFNFAFLLQLHCCGMNNASDYIQFHSVPTSCFDQAENKSSAFVIYEHGCKLPLIGYVKTLILKLSMTQFCSVVLQVNVIVFATQMVLPLFAVADDRNLYFLVLLQSDQREES